MRRRRNRSADVHAKGRFLGSGPLVAHIDASGKIREKDGAFYRGAELGYVDHKHRIRRRAGLLKRGEVVGQIRGNSVYGRLAPLLGTERWGYIDQFGNVWQQGSETRPPRIIGKARGADPEAALAYFVLKFQDLADQVRALEEKTRRSDDKSTFLPRIRAIQKALPEMDALGDIDSIAERLSALEAQCATGLGRQLIDATARLGVLNRHASTLSIERLRSSWEVATSERRQRLETVLVKVRGRTRAILDKRLPSPTGRVLREPLQVARLRARLTELRRLRWHP